MPIQIIKQQKRTNTKYYLPIGSIILLKNGQKKLMITGYYVTDVSNNKIYDYSACIYPEGIVDNKTIILFNHEDIFSIIFKGYSDEDEKKHKVALKYLIQQDLNTVKEDVTNDSSDSNNLNVMNDSSSTINLENLFD